MIQNIKEFQRSLTEKKKKLNTKFYLKTTNDPEQSTGNQTLILDN